MVKSFVVTVRKRQNSLTALLNLFNYLTPKFWILIHQIKPLESTTQKQTFDLA
jgi:hypothetical protein